MLTILTIVGTRPEAIKMAPVILELAAHAEQVRSVVCSTGQHGELLEQVWELFGLKPDVSLGLMREDQSLPELTGRLLTALDRVIADYQPDWIMAQGDTTTVLGAALAAFYRKVPFGHVEAGLRTGSLESPFPEELNRRIADQVARRRFAPTPHARDCLLQEGCAPETIVVTGNTVIDALAWVRKRPYDASRGPLSGLPTEGRLVLVTAHRRESFGAPLHEMCLAIRELAETFGPQGVQFVYPVHPNPHVRAVVHQMLGTVPSLTLLEPLDYPSLVELMARATLILTDSGGLQEEGPELKVPVLVMRDATERPEAVAAGVARLVGTSRASIVAQAAVLLSDEAARRQMICDVNPFGDGHAATRIVASLLE